MKITVKIRKKADRSDLLLYFIDPFTRREVSRTAGTSDRREAERAAALWEQQLLTYRGPVNDGWQYFRDRFRDEHLATLSQSSFNSYTTALNHYQRLLNPERVPDLTAAAVSLFQAKLIDEKRPLSSVANYLTHIRSALNWAVDVGIIDKAPKVKLPRQPKRVFMRSRPITESEYRKMLRTCPKVCGDEADAVRRLLELLWLSGLRLGEALRLSWTRQPIIADLAATPYPQLVFYAEGHKSRRDDVVPMTPDLAAWLSKTPAKERRGLVVRLHLATQPRISDLISAIGREAKIVVNDDGKFASAHDFRRAFGTRWAQKVMPMTLQKLMRHADIQTTLRYYVGLSATDAGREIWAGEIVPLVPKNVPKSRSKRTKAG